MGGQRSKTLTEQAFRAGRSEGPVMAVEEQAAAESVLRRSLAFDRFAASAAVLDGDGVIVETNESWRLAAVIQAGGPVGADLGSDYVARCDELAHSGNVHATVIADGLRSIIRGDRVSFEHEYPSPSALEDRWFTLHASAAPVSGGSGVVMFHLDTTARRLLVERLAHEGGRPAGPANIEAELARVARVGGRVTVLGVRFETVVAVEADLGRSGVDEVLVQVTARLRSVLRADDPLSRIGAGDLYVVLPDLGDDALHAVVGRLRQALAAPFRVGATEVSVAIGVGAASSVDGSTADSLVAAALGGARVGDDTASSAVVPLIQRPVVRPRNPAAALGSARERAQRDAVVGRSNDMVMFFEADGTIAWASPATRLAGIDPSDLVGRNGLDMVHAEDRDRVFAAFLTIVEPGDHVTIDFRVVTDDGTVRWIRETATNLVDDPDVGYVVANLTDITAKKRDEDALRLSGWLLDAAGLSIVAVDMVGDVIYWNAGATGIYGWTAAEAIGHPVRELILPAVGWADEMEAVNERTRGGGMYSGEFRVRGKAGVDIPIDATNTPVHDDHGTQIGIVAVSSDLSERKRLEAAHAQLSAIVRSSTDAIVGVDLDGTVTSWNHAAEALYGHPAEYIIGRSVWETVPLDLQPQAKGIIEAARIGEGFRDLETRRLRADGTEIHVSVKPSPIVDAAGVLVGASAIVRDISESVRLREAHDADRRRLADAQRSAQLGSFEFDVAVSTAIWSEEFNAILGLGPQDPASPRAFRSRVHRDDLAMVDAALATAITTGVDGACTFRIVRPDGVERWVVARTSGATIGCTAVSGTMQDVTERKLLEFDLRTRASHDALTGLPNRTLLIERLEAALGTVHPADLGVGVMIFGVDRFKLINDSLGHVRGDEVLVAVGEAMAAAMEDGEFVARFGSDIFAVVVPHLTTPERLVAVADRVRSKLSTGLVVGADRYAPLVSVGLVVAYPGDDPIAVLRDADTAMYRAKDRGRDRTEWFVPALRTAVMASYELERDLRHALDNDELRLVFQPVFDLETGETPSCEALVRWAHPERGEISPDEFIPVAESSGLIVPIGAWILREALTVASGWPASVSVAVNLSARQLSEPALTVMVQDTMAEIGFPASRLILEVTETAVLQDRVAAARTIAALRAAGVRVVIDDFGTGYTSLGFLRDYALDGLKIDRSFVTGIDQGSTAIVDAIIRMAGALDLRVIAEGIETEAQLEQLRSLGCRYIQGFLVSPPVSATEIRARWEGPAGSRGAPPARPTAL